MPIDWSQIGNAPIFERGNYFSPGRYKLRLLRCLSKQTQKSGLAFISEFEVLESDNPAHQIGSKGTFFVKMDNMQQGYSNVLEMMVALLGFDIKNSAHINQIDQQLRPQLTGLMNSLEKQGTAVLGPHETVAVECRVTLTKRNTEFTLHMWSPWTPAPGWQPVATPTVAAMPQRQAVQPTAAAPQGYPPAYGAPQQGAYPPAYGAPPSPPAFAPAALPAFAPPSPPTFAPGQPQAYGAPAPVPGQPQAYGAPAPVPGQYWPPKQ